MRCDRLLAGSVLGAALVLGAEVTRADSEGLLDADLVLGGGGDSNPAGLDPDLFDLPELRGVQAFGGIDGIWRWKNDPDGRLARTHQLSLGGSYFVFRDTESAGRLTGHVRGHLDVWTGEQDPSTTLGKRVSLGVSYERQELENLGVDQVDHDRYTAAAQLTFQGEDNCNWRNVTLFLAYDDATDQLVPEDPVFDRGGIRRSLAVEFLDYSQGARRRAAPCLRTGPFRSIVPVDIWGYRVGFQLEDQNTQGSEFAGRFHWLYGAFHKPIACKGGPCSRPANPAALSVQGRLDLGYLDYRSPSALDPMTTHADWWTEVELAALLHLKRKYPVRLWDLRISAAYARSSSDIPAYDYDRFWFFAGIELGFRQRTGGGMPAAGGSRVGGRGGQSGSSDPTVPGGG